jgi:hypothetical protein
MSILANKLSSEVSNPLNAVFEKELTAMSKDCSARLKKLVENEFLVLSSLLDPRFTACMEILLKKQFRDYIGALIKLFKKYQGTDQNEIDAGIDVLESASDSNTQEDDFFGLFGQQEVSSSQAALKREFEDQAEVGLLY